MPGMHPDTFQDRLAALNYPGGRGLGVCGESAGLCGIREAGHRVGKDVSKGALGVGQRIADGGAGAQRVAQQEPLLDAQLRAYGVELRDPLAGLVLFSLRGRR